MKPSEAHIEVFPNTYELINFINAKSLTKNDILTVLYIGQQLFLIYFE